MLNFLSPKSFLFLAVSLLITVPTRAQNIYTTLNQQENLLLDKAEIKQGIISHTSLKPFSVKELMDSTSVNDSSELVQRYKLFYNKEKTRHQRFLYANNQDFYSVSTKDFKLRINPIIYFSGGKNLIDKETIFTNTRGIRLSGTIDNKVSFHTAFTDNQARLPRYVDKQIALHQAIPYQNLWKKFKLTGYDYFNAQGYINFHVIKHIDLTLGYGTLFLGDGNRSLLLSGYAGNMPYMRINTKIWKINYSNIYAKMTASFPTSGGVPIDGLYPTKYLTAHYLSIDILKNLNIGLYEAVVLSRTDSTGIDYGYDLAYLNPIIFYRSVEQNLGSPDNAILGLNMKWNVAKTLSFYGQFVLDEFKLDEIKSFKGWWANKYGGQLGAKYIDAFGVKNLHLQSEINIVRPYTYSHGRSVSSYTHFQKPLAHPLGANFAEAIGIIKYAPTHKLFFTTKATFIKTGRDGKNQNWGSNPFLNNQSKQQVYGNRIGQGIATKIALIKFSASYQVFPNIFLDLDILKRKETSQASTSYIGFGIRANTSRVQHNF